MNTIYSTLEFGECYSHQLAHGSYCYEFNTTHVDWKTAQQTCRNNKGDLISIHSPVEQALLNLNSGSLGYDLPTWIGRKIHILLLFSIFYIFLKLHNTNQ